MKYRVRFRVLAALALGVTLATVGIWRAYGAQGNKACKVAFPLGANRTAECVWVGGCAIDDVHCPIIVVQVMGVERFILSCDTFTEGTYHYCDAFPATSCTVLGGSETCMTYLGYAEGDCSGPAWPLTHTRKPCKTNFDYP